MQTGAVTRVLGIVGLALAVTAGPGAARPGPEQASAGSFDLAAANRLVDAYFRHVVSRLPRDWRQAEERKLKTTPPRLSPAGLFQVMGPDGTLVFEHDAERQILHCLAVVMKLRDEFPIIGLTQDEILDALRARQAQGTSTGGGQLIYDPVSNGFFLQRDYTEPPRDTKQVIRELDRLTETGEAWFRTHYLEAVLSHAKTLAPPAEATARDGNFRATIVLSPDPRYFDLWKRPPGVRQPQLVSRGRIVKPASLFVQLFFSGATAGDDGRAVVEGELSVTGPDGGPMGRLPVPLWNAPPPPADHLQLGDNHTEIELDAARPAGRYVVRARVCDVAARRCVTVEHPVDVTPR